MLFEKYFAEHRLKSEKRRFEKELLGQLSLVEKKLENVNAVYNMTDDEDLIEALIYEEQGLKMRHKYLTGIAKKNDIKCGTVIR